jgi:phosphate transport system substrate-binding protein
MKHSKFSALGVSAAVAATFTFIAPAQAAVDIIQIDGSSTVYPISEAVAEEFQKETGIKVTVGVSGTGGGFKKFCRGDTVISNASRPIKAKEVKKCKEAGINFIEIPVAFDALTVVINPANDWATEMTPEELKMMWEPEAQGKITNWKQVRSGFPDVPLKLYGPGADSGTFDYFTEAIIKKSKAIRGDFTASEDDNILVQGVAGDKGGIGYFGLAYYEENKDKLNAVQVDAGNGCQPPEAAFEGNYYLARPLYIYISESVKEDQVVKAFVDFYFEAMDIIVPAVGYVPMLEDQKANALSAWQNFSS